MFAWLVSQHCFVCLHRIRHISIHASLDHVVVRYPPRNGHLLPVSRSLSKQGQDTWQCKPLLCKTTKIQNWFEQKGKSWFQDNTGDECQMQPTSCRCINPSRCSLVPEKHVMDFEWKQIQDDFNYRLGGFLCVECTFPKVDNCVFPNFVSNFCLCEFLSVVGSINFLSTRKTENGRALWHWTPDTFSFLVFPVTSSHWCEKEKADVWSGRNVLGRGHISKNHLLQRFASHMEFHIAFCVHKDDVFTRTKHRPFRRRQLSRTQYEYVGLSTSAVRKLVMIPFDFNGVMTTFRTAEVESASYWTPHCQTNSNPLVNSGKQVLLFWFLRPTPWRDVVPWRSESDPGLHCGEALRLNLLRHYYRSLPKGLLRKERLKSAGPRHGVCRYLWCRLLCKPIYWWRFHQQILDMYSQPNGFELNAQKVV